MVGVAVGSGADGEAGGGEETEGLGVPGESDVGGRMALRSSKFWPKYLRLTSGLLARSSALPLSKMLPSYRR